MEKNKPKVGIFTRPIDQGTSGSGSHLEKLVKHILKANSEFDIEFIHYTSKRDKDIYKGIRDIVIPRNPIKASKILKKEGFDILHYSPLTFFAPIWLKGVKKVATIHGAAPLFLPKQYSLVKKLHDKYLRAYLSRKMDHIFTVSKASRDYLVKDYKLAPDNISITYNAVDSYFKVLETRESGDNYKHIFHLSKYSSRKNPDVILKGFKEICKQTEDIKLILAGSGWNNPKVTDYLKDNGLGDRVIFPGFVTNERIVELFNTSDLFVFPSHYEGFGMPNIEAMACGCPVLTSRVFAIPEVVGDAAVTMEDHTDPVEFAAKSLEIINSSELRKTLIEKGLERAKAFSWEDSAQTVLNTYKELLK